ARSTTAATTAAAISSGRTVRSAPRGALPTAVRAAATITAFRLPFFCIFCKRVPPFTHAPCCTPARNLGGCQESLATSALSETDKEQSRQAYRRSVAGLYPTRTHSAN